MIRLNVNFTPTTNFWDINPQVGLITPFRRLRDKYGDEESSKYMWTIFFFCHPNEEENLLFRYPEEERKSYITKNYFQEIDWNCVYFLDAMDEYPFHLQTAIERALREEKDSLISRAKFLKNAEYDLKSARVLDTMRSSTKKIYEGLDETIKKYTESVEESGEVWGGRNETAAERGQM
jgi:hypothetical protein